MIYIYIYIYNKNETFITKWENFSCTCKRLQLSFIPLQMLKRKIKWCHKELRVTSYELRVGHSLYELRVTFCEMKIKITSCQTILLVTSYYSRVMSYFLRVENKNYELQVMALFHLKKKFTKHSEDRKSLLPV